MRRLLVVLAIVALAACGTKSGKKPKRWEPDAVFAAIKPVLEREALAKGAFPAAHVDHVPATACCDNPDHVCKPADLEGQPWIDAGLLPARYNFQLSYDSDGPTVTIHAMGDADCDMISTDTELGGTIQDKKVVWTITKNAEQD